MIVIWWYIPDILCFFVQDTILIIPPYPYNLEDHHDVPLEDMWYTRPASENGSKPKNADYKTGQDDKTYSFVFFSTFAVLDLPIKGPMEDAGVTKLYEPSPTPCLYVAPAANMAGRVPLIPLFLAWNSTPTIPHMFSKRKDTGFPYGCADAAATDGRRGSNVYEVNLWLWSFARGKPRLGGLSVEETFERQVAANKASKERAAENRRRRKALADKAWFKVKEVFDSMYTWYISVYTQYIWSHPWNIPLYTHNSHVTVWTAI
jgi:hypothetical protein